MIESLVAERWVIGSILLDPWGGIAKARAVLQPTDFVDPKMRTIFESCCELADAGMPSDHKLIWRHILKGTSSNEFAREVRELAYLIQEETPVALHVEYYARCMVEDACARAATEAAAALEAKADREDIQAALGALSKANERLMGLEKKHRAMLEGKLKDTVVEYLEALERDKQGKCGNVPTPLVAFDDFIGGPVAQGSYVILGACSGNGKTLFMLQMMRNAAKSGHHCVFYSQEMSATAIGERLVTMASNSAKPAEIMSDVDRFFGYGEDIVFRQCDSRVTSIVADMQRMIDECGATVFAVDYLGLLRGTGKSRYEEMTQVNSILKSFATQHNVTILMGCQLNRAVMNAKPPIPQKHHLRDSGEIEASADAIFLLRYPWKDSTPEEIAEEYPDSEPKEVFEIYVPKLRNRETKGECFICKLKSNPLRLAPTLETHERHNYSQELAEF